jgi:Asp-tRNA(Asn)/Glu-tRNA(Gln) amidotransferase A subunit family amidase/phosphopantetheinyl transferase
MEYSIVLSIRHISDFQSFESPIDGEYLNAFSDEQRRKESVAARLELNRLAQLHWGEDLAQMGFHKNSNGKPMLGNGLHCSISHADGWVFVGMGAVPFGIDIERFNLNEHLFLEHAFSPETWKTLRNHPWRAYVGFSEKEAIAKKNGTGFLIDPKSIEKAPSDWLTSYRMTSPHQEAYVLTVCADSKVPIKIDHTADIALGASLDIATLIEGYASGLLDVASVVSECLHRIERQDPHYRSVLHINSRAMQEAQRLDAEWASSGKLRGALHGVPVLIKANIQTSDAMPTSCGSVLLENHFASEDAPIVRNLKELGAVILGKTNLSEFCNYVSNASPSGFSSLGGTTLSIWGPDYAVGGSSSGSAVAAAAHFCSFAIGTETDGSVVYPAALNSVFAYKPADFASLADGVLGISTYFDRIGLFADSLQNLDFARKQLFPRPDAIHSTSIWLERTSFDEEEEAAELIAALNSRIAEAGLSIVKCQLSEAIEPYFSALDIICKTEFKRDTLPKLPMSSDDFLAYCRTELLHKHHPDIEEIERSSSSNHAEDGSYQDAISQLETLREEWHLRFEDAGFPIVLALTTGPSEIASIATLLGLSHVVIPWDNDGKCNPPLGISLMANEGKVGDLIHSARMIFGVPLPV